MECWEDAIGSEKRGQDDRVSIYWLIWECRQVIRLSWTWKYNENLRLLREELKRIELSRKSTPVEVTLSWIRRSKQKPCRKLGLRRIVCPDLSSSLHHHKYQSQKIGPPDFLVGSAPRINVLQRPKTLHLLVLHTLHSSLRVIFLVCLAFFFRMGFVWPPKPFYLAAYLLLPCALLSSLPFLYWTTLCLVCFLHFKQ